MKHISKIHNRRSIRLKGYDYSKEGQYFVTTCCYNHEMQFGYILEGKMNLNDAGKMIENEWLELTNRFTNIILHEFLVMPNHFHGILEIVGANTRVAKDEDKVKDQNKDKDKGQDQNKDIQDQNKENQNKTQNQTRSQIKDHEGKADNGDNGRPQGYAPTGYAPTGYAPTNKKLGEMIGAFLSITTVKYITGVKSNNWKRFDGKLWQRNYWEHIIRNDKSYQKISNYIKNNPKKWDEDKFKKL